MTYRIAAVSFLNTIPLIDWFTRQDSAPVELKTALPSELSAALTGGRADTALVPVAEFLRGHTGGLLSPSGIACDGPVGSVALFSSCPLEKVTRVRADRGSRSSVVLTRLLLAERHGLRPEFTEFRPTPGCRPEPGEALLVIGDACLAMQADLARAGEGGVLQHDLGALWQELTGLPFVFAAWAASADFARSAPERVAELSDLLTRARNEGLDRLDQLAAEQAAIGKLGHRGEATAAAIAYYFRQSLVFELGDRELAGMRRYRELALRHGLVPDLPFPELLFR
jgi:chorismate dehydratase